MVERRESTPADSVGGGHSWADDNIERGAEGADFVKRKPTYPIGDNPRGREINFQSDEVSEAYASKNQVFRAYRGSAPLEGQDFGAPTRRGSLQKLKDLRPEMPNRSVDAAALNAIKEKEREVLRQTDFMALFPVATVTVPAPGSTFSAGDQITIHGNGRALTNLTQAVLLIDGVAVDRRVIDRRDQESAVAEYWNFHFIYNIPPNRPLGQMEIMIRVFNFATSLQGMVADDALNKPPLADPIQTGRGSIAPRIKHQATSSLGYSQQLQETGILRTPEGVSSINVFIV